MKGTKAGGEASYGHSNSMENVDRRNCHAPILGEECAVYWSSIYEFVRRKGYGTADAQDLTQDFFIHLMTGDLLRRVDPSKGSFRGYLFASVRHFLANQWDRRNAEKRGGGCKFVALEGECNGVGDSPGEALDAKWIEMALCEAMERLERECATNGLAGLFDSVRNCLAGDKVEKYALIGERHAMSVAKVAKTVERLRTRLRVHFETVVAEKLIDPRRVGEELEVLRTALREAAQRQGLSTAGCSI